MAERQAVASKLLPPDSGAENHQTSQKGLLAGPWMPRAAHTRTSRTWAPTPARRVKGRRTAPSGGGRGRRTREYRPSPGSKVGAAEL